MAIENENRYPARGRKGTSLVGKFRKVALAGSGDAHILGIF